MNDDSAFDPHHAPDAPLARIPARIAQLQHELSGVKYISSGTLQKRTKRCGNPACRCATDPKARHGPYYEWSYMHRGKLKHRTLTPEQAELMRLAIGNYRRVKRLLKSWEVETRRLIGVQ
jgi:hypothetical protein